MGASANNRIGKHDCAESIGPTIRNEVAKIRDTVKRGDLRSDDDGLMAAWRQSQASNLVASLAGSLGARYSPDRATMANYRVYHSRQKLMVDRLAAISDEIETFVSGGRGIVWYGSVGTGKDHCLAAMLYRAASAGLAARWVDCQELFGASRDRIGTNDSEQELLGRLVSPTVLGLSDLLPPAGGLSNWNVILLRRVVDARNREMRPTWVTANADDEREMVQVLTPQIWSRLREGAEVFRCQWPDYRTMEG